ncbi:MAG: hypothetical protein KKD01_08865 [Proteobacteria bacterium]|nr:hypothetical protein [Pseudomonadota bacterium]MBU1139803.1 hypothetical protein [Pseudomonadota bacterium]MBU1231848.1 hypothetical protein [Pseudomonadota bacterium]MBU1418915.1 hypothetical protein [Pseudomonadota bacterium]MBU1454821.1 hypothetical protein [Pseudomonadota bacterium]
MKIINNIIFPFFSVAALMTFYQVGKFYLLKGSYTIWQSHIMTIVFTSLVATIVSLVMVNRTEKIEKDKKELELRESKIRTLQITMFTVHHIVNNFLNRLLLIRIEAEEEGTISQESLEKLEADISDVSRKLVALSELEHPENPENFNKFFPQHNKS